MPVPIAMLVGGAFQLFGLIFGGLSAKKKQKIEQQTLALENLGIDSGKWWSFITDRFKTYNTINKVTDEAIVSETNTGRSWAHQFHRVGGSVLPNIDPSVLPGNDFQLGLNPGTGSTTANPLVLSPLILVVLIAVFKYFLTQK